VNHLVDTSVWVDYFRDPDGVVAEQLAAIIRAQPGRVLGCPPVRMELASDEQDFRRRRLLRTYDSLPSSGITSDDFDLAAAIYRVARAHGQTIRSHLDCVIGAIALRLDAVLVHNDVDFDRMAECVPDLAVLRLPDG
jgi:predicted nucleic acid-binding protein